ncbi:MAG: DEAD/DEAH box helicase family protein, partial [Candidatus Pacearchaeota archaeon]
MINYEEKMWNLYRIKKDGKSGYLNPLVFSNNKTQEDIVNEVVNSIKSGCKIIFIKGVCGSGKSAIALNIAKEIGRASIVVPIKSLQKQYEEDYSYKKYVIKNNGEKLKIKIITGRQNHKCPFANCQADDKELPCTIEIKKKNLDKIKEYLEENPFVDIKNFKQISDVRRLSIASICPYWCPIVPAYREIEILKNSQ